MRAMLTELGLESWLKTSGGKGLHVVVPLAPKLDYDTVKGFSQAVVQHLARTIPQRFVAKSGGANRVGRIFVDYLRNGHGATTAAAFSARARPGLGVSMPVAWEQLMALKGGAQWTIATAREYLCFEKADPWAGYWKTKQTLAAGMKMLGLASQRRFRNGRGDKALALARMLRVPPRMGPPLTRRIQELFMAARSIASLSLSFGLVSIPVKLYSATESSASVRFNMLAKDGSRLKQQYVSEKDQTVVERAEMVKGYEFEKDRFVIFTPDELKALQESPSHTIDIVAFIPDKAVDPIYYDKAYFLAPDKRGGKPYNLLMEAMRAERPLRARQVGLEGQAVRRPGAPGRRRPGAAAAALRRRGALDEGARHREGHGLAEPSSSSRCS